MIEELSREPMVRSDPQSIQVDGCVEVLFSGRVQGWAWDSSRPEARLTIVVRDKQQILAEVEANQFRKDLFSAGIGDGYYGFDVRTRWTGEARSLTAAVKGTDYELPIHGDAYNPKWLNPDNLPDTQINFSNLNRLQAGPSSRYFYIRLDTNWNCNLHCVYCHNPRSKDLLDKDSFKEFLDTRVISVENFQIGCAMEPTLDRRLTDFMLMVAKSPARPKNTFQLQTNGILLHRHSVDAMKAAGLTSLSVSLDSAEPDTQKLLRSGTSLRKVLTNVAGFIEACPDISVQFITTVTSANIGKLSKVVELGLDMGVSNFAFRELFYDPMNTIVDHDRVPALLLKDGQFADASCALRDRFPAISLEFFDDDALSSAETKIKADSFL